MWACCQPLSCESKMSAIHDNLLRRFIKILQSESRSTNICSMLVRAQTCRPKNNQCIEHKPSTSRTKVSQTPDHAHDHLLAYPWHSHCRWTVMWEHPR